MSDENSSNQFDIYRELTPEESEELDRLIALMCERYRAALEYLAER